MKIELLQRACAQLALDYNARPEDFLSDEITITEAADLPGRRKYAPGAPFFEMATTGRGAVISADRRLHPALREWAAGNAGHWLFEHPHLMELEEILRPYGWELYQTHHMFLPGKPFAPAPVPEGFSLRWFDEKTVCELYPNTRFPNAISEEENALRPDVIALAALDGENMAALAGASADCEKMWQVGIDVLPEYRGRGLGTGLVKTLCAKIEGLGKLPFYGTSLSNLHSQNIAANCGFFPAWVEASSRKTSVVSR